MSEQPKPLTEQEIKNWTRDAYQKAIGFLGENGIITEIVVQKDSRYLAPLLAVWKVKSNKGKYYWVISGELPTDFMSIEGAASAREAIRAFSMRWQLQAEQIRQADQIDESQLEFAVLLETRAEQLYELFNQETLWKYEA